jgi:hypothetical protein
MSFVTPILAGSGERRAFDRYSSHRGRLLRGASARADAAVDAAEFGLLLTLMTIASPLVRAYYFVWLLFPITVLVYRAAGELRTGIRRALWALLGLAMALFAISPLYGHAQWQHALGILLWAATIIAAALAWRLHHDSMTDGRTDVASFAV